MKRSPRLLKRLPPNRTYESILRHFEVERALARQLRAADRAGRRTLYGTMYDELYSQVPDHPRLTRRDSVALTDERIRRTIPVVSRFVKPGNTYVEFAPGDCRVAFEMAKLAQHVIGIEIADQLGEDARPPDNFRLVLYDGYELDLAPESVDVVFSDQLIEHFHPEDTEHHFRLVHRILRPGGVYVFRTPHRQSGPHDISAFFTTTAEGFHLKEWTYGDLVAVLRATNYRHQRGYWGSPLRLFRLPLTAFRTAEFVLNQLPHRPRGALARLFPRGITMAAVK